MLRRSEVDAKTNCPTASASSNRGSEPKAANPPWHASVLHGARLEIGSPRHQHQQADDVFRYVFIQGNLAPHLNLDFHDLWRKLALHTQASSKQMKTERTKTTSFSQLRLSKFEMDSVNSIFVQRHSED